jgi:transcriptional regulator with XRE-family HTH domain
MPFKEVGDAERGLREEAGIGLRELARNVDMQHSILAAVESGRRPLAPYVTRLARRLGSRVFDVADIEESLSLRDADFRRSLALALLVGARSARAFGFWGTPTPEQVEALRREHLLSLDWDSKLSVEEITRQVSDACGELTPEELAEITKAVEQRRELEKARQAALRESAE